LGFFLSSPSSLHASILLYVKGKMLSTTNNRTTFAVDSSSSLLQKDLRRRFRRFLLSQKTPEGIGRGRERQQLQQTFNKMNSKTSSSSTAACCRSLSASSSSRSMFATTRTTTRTTTLNKRMVVQTKAGGGGTSLVPVSDRVVAFLPYLLPLISGLRYSRYFFAAFPAAIIMLQPLLPIVKIVATLPLGNLIPFFAAYLGVARNQNLSRFCRFNGMQAILLDIVLIFPGLLESLFSREILGITIPYFLSKWMYNVIWVGLVVAFALCAVGCATGRYVNLPVVSEAAEAQMR